MFCQITIKPPIFDYDPTPSLRVQDRQRTWEADLHCATFLVSGRNRRQVPGSGSYTRNRDSFLRVRYIFGKTNTVFLPVPPQIPLRLAALYVIQTLGTPWVEVVGVGLRLLCSNPPPRHCHGFPPRLQVDCGGGNEPAIIANLPTTQLQVLTPHIVYSTAEAVVQF